MALFVCPEGSRVSPHIVSGSGQQRCVFLHKLQIRLVVLKKRACLWVVVVGGWIESKTKTARDRSSCIFCPTLNFSVQFVHCHSSLHILLSHPSVTLLLFSSPCLNVPYRLCCLLFPVPVLSSPPTRMRM